MRRMTAPFVSLKALSGTDYFDVGAKSAESTMCVSYAIIQSGT